MMPCLRDHIDRGLFEDESDSLTEKERRLVRYSAVGSSMLFKFCLELRTETLRQQREISDLKTRLRRRKKKNESARRQLMTSMAAELERFDGEQRDSIASLNRRNTAMYQRMHDIEVDQMAWWTAIQDRALTMERKAERVGPSDLLAICVS